jgi:hypothetical protein
MVMPSTATAGLPFDQLKSGYAWLPHWQLLVVLSSLQRPPGGGTHSKLKTPRPASCWKSGGFLLEVGLARGLQSSRFLRFCFVCACLARLLRASSTRRACGPRNAPALPAPRACSRATANQSSQCWTHVCLEEICPGCPPLAPENQQNLAFNDYISLPPSHRSEEEPCRGWAEVRVRARARLGVGLVNLHTVKDESTCSLSPDLQWRRKPRRQRSQGPR